MYRCRLLSWVFSKTINLSFNGILDVTLVWPAYYFTYLFRVNLTVHTTYIRGGNKGSQGFKQFFFSSLRANRFNLNLFVCTFPYLFSNKVASKPQNLLKIAPLILYKYLQNEGETRKKRLNCIFQTCTLHIDTTFILHTYALMYGSHHFLLSNYLLALHDLKAGNKVYGYYYTINLGPLYYSLYVI